MGAKGLWEGSAPGDAPEGRLPEVVTRRGATEGDEARRPPAGPGAGGRWLLTLLVAASWACGGDVPTTPTPTATAAAPTVTPSPAPAPTATPAPPTASPTPHPTSAPSPSDPPPTPSPEAASAAPTPSPSAPPSPSPTPVTDLDGDGFGPSEGDCDDEDGARHPLAEEGCDGIDNDCDGRTDDDDPDLVAPLTYPDEDGDGFGDATGGMRTCDPPEGALLNDRDCDDDDPERHPNAQEICDPEDVDEDCDGYADEADGSVDASTRDPYAPDWDGDGYGDVSAIPVLACDPPSGALAYSLARTDCDDVDATIHPGAAEACDALDRDCDGVVDEGFDADLDGTSDCVDDDGDGATERQGDCDDGAPERYPFAPGVTDTDWDGWGDACDDCPRVFNPDQGDRDGDGLGDACTVTPGGTWGAPTPIFPLPAPGDGKNDRDPALTADGRCLYFSSDRPGGEGHFDLWVMCRETVGDPFGEPAPLGAGVNSPAFEGQPALSVDGRALYFVRGQEESAELYRAQRQERGEPFGAPVALGTLNAPGVYDGAPSPAPDGLALYFISERSGRGDVYRAAITEDGVGFSSPVLVGSVSSEYAELTFSLRADGLWGVLSSARGDGSGADLYGLSRSGEGAAFGPAVVLESLCSPDFDGGATVRADGRELVFFSSREGPFVLLRSEKVWAP